MLFNQNELNNNKKDIKRKKDKELDQEQNLIINEDATYASLGFGEFNENSYKKY